MGLHPLLKPKPDHLKNIWIENLTAFEINFKSAFNFCSRVRTSWRAQFFCLFGGLFVCFCCCCFWQIPQSKYSTRKMELTFNFFFFPRSYENCSEQCRTKSHDLQSWASTWAAGPPQSPSGPSWLITRCPCQRFLNVTQGREEGKVCFLLNHEEVP